MRHGADGRKKKEVGSEPAVKQAVVKPAEKSVTAPPRRRGLRSSVRGDCPPQPSGPAGSDEGPFGLCFSPPALPAEPVAAAAETFIRLIDEAEVSREMNRQEHLLLDKVRVEQERLLQENDAPEKDDPRPDGKTPGGDGGSRPGERTAQKGSPAPEVTGDRAPEAGADAPLIG